MHKEEKKQEATAAKQQANDDWPQTYTMMSNLLYGCYKGSDHQSKAIIIMLLIKLHQAQHACY